MKVCQIKAAENNAIEYKLPNGGIALVIGLDAKFRPLIAYSRSGLGDNESWDWVRTDFRKNEKRG